MNEDKVIYEIIAKQAKVEAATLTPATLLSDLDLQSIDVVELVFALEEKFDISVPYAPGEEDAISFTFTTVGELTEAIKKFVAQQHPAG